LWRCTTPKNAKKKRQKTPKLTTLTMFEKNLTTSPPDFFKSLHWGFHEISLGGRFFLVSVFLFWCCKDVDNAKTPKNAENVKTNLSK
jgi:hypothetical protein